MSVSHTDICGTLDMLLIRSVGVAEMRDDELTWRREEG